MIRHQKAWREILKTLSICCWMGWILWSAYVRLARFFPPVDYPLNGDAVMTYLPAARKLLADPWLFLTTDQQSYNVAPLGYIWPALWGADPITIQLANCALFMLALVLMWHCSYRIGGFLAGVASTALMVFHPTMVFYATQVLTESMYLFSVMLFAAGLVEFVLNPKWRRTAMVCITLGLTIGLLVRPILQLFILGSLVLLALLACWLRWGPKVNAARRTAYTLCRQLCICLLLALLAPALVIAKNGIYFQHWALATGSGTGLYYGVSPFKSGLEPVFSGFGYDAGAIVATVDPATHGNPLHTRSDKITTRVAVEIVRNTTLWDNVKFFSYKFYCWMFYSTPELMGEPKLRPFRILEWLAILFGAVIIFAPRRRASDSISASIAAPLLDNRRKLLFALLVLTPFAMAAQLTPILYNDRYNIFFIEPWLFMAAGIGFSAIFTTPSARKLFSVQGLPWLVTRGLAATLLFVLPAQLTKYALHHELWGVDPYRLGPTEMLIDNPRLGPVHATGATQRPDGAWITNQWPATLRVALPKNYNYEAISEYVIVDAIWRTRFALTPGPGATRACRKVAITVTPSEAVRPGFKALHTVNAQPDGNPHTYAIFGNHEHRPTGPGYLEATFDCPVNTLIGWEAAELLRVTMPQAALALIQSAVPLNLYRREDPH